MPGGGEPRLSRERSTPSARRVVAVSLAVNLLDVVTNAVVAWLTGSAVIFSEMAKGLADALGSLFLVIGERRSRRRGDAAYPLGYGREVFFWSLLSAVAMLVVGAGLSAWRGYRQLVDPQPLEHTGFAVAVLCLAIVTNGYAVGLSLRKLVAETGSLGSALRSPRRPLVQNAFFRDVVGTFTPAVGLVAILAYVVLDWAVIDALGALVGAGLFAGFALVLIGRARALITGRSLPASDLERLDRAVHATPEVVAINRLAAIHAGAKEVLVDLDLDLAEDLDTTAVERVLDDVEARVRRVLPLTREVRVQLNSPPSAPRRP